ncbi:uncharacterized protein LOC117101174 isoform X2 [Anneissia japonica]|uniref:uncharacterized protein LOC117101174 isoform X2 n=1 Tax=Anneissia japonica TaxID=1529436 RepID=UPI0014257CD9|nr:uncharacterized protein LOC117101174 isoform X2 [Anneissia japonica]
MVMKTYYQPPCTDDRFDISACKIIFCIAASQAQRKKIIIVQQSTLLLGGESGPAKNDPWMNGPAKIGNTKSGPKWEKIK